MTPFQTPPPPTTPPPLPPVDPRVFAALGDPTRLGLVERLRAAPGASTTELTAHTAISRQAVTRHLEVLAQAGLVRSVSRGRERQWSLDAAPLRGVVGWASSFEALWEERLERLDAYVQTLSPEQHP